MIFFHITVMINVFNWHVNNVGFNNAGKRAYFHMQNTIKFFWVGVLLDFGGQKQHLFV